MYAHCVRFVVDDGKKELKLVIKLLYICDAECSKHVASVQIKSGTFSTPIISGLVEIYISTSQ